MHTFRFLLFHNMQKVCCIIYPYQLNSGAHGGGVKWQEKIYKLKKKLMYNKIHSLLKEQWKL